MHLLLIATPRPQMFFAWIIGPATVIAVVHPFSTTAALSQKAATAVINLVLGAAIGSLINGTAARVIGNERSLLLPAQLPRVGAGELSCRGGTHRRFTRFVPVAGPYGQLPPIQTTSVSETPLTPLGRGCRTGGCP